MGQIAAKQGDKIVAVDLRNLASIWCTVKRGTRYARADFTEEVR